MAVSSNIGFVDAADSPRNTIAPRAPAGRAWSDMDYGPYLTMSIEAPEPQGNIAYKGLMIALDRETDSYVLFDTDLLRYAAGWSGGTINWRSVIYDGSHNTHPLIVGRQHFSNGVRPGWGNRGSFADPRKLPYGPLPRPHARYRGLYLHGDRIVISYTVGDSHILESPGLEKQGSISAFTRTLEVGPSETDRMVQIVERAGSPGSILGVDSLKPLKIGASAKTSIAVLGTIKPQVNAKNEAAQEPIVPTKGLIARWLFNEGKGRTTHSADNKARAALNKAGWTSGKNGTGLRVERGSHAIVETISGLKWGGADYSVAAWVKTSKGGTIVSLTKPGPWVPGGKTLFVRNGRLAFDIGWVGAVSSSQPVADGRWHHVALTHRSRDGLVQLYVDGRPDGRKRLKSDPDPDDSQLRFGFTSQNFPRGGSNRLNGVIDEVTIYNRVLSAEEIKNMAPDTVEPDDSITAVAFKGPAADWTWEITKDSCVRLHIPARSKTQRAKLFVWHGASKDLQKFADLVAAADPPEDLQRLTQGGPARFPVEVSTKGKLGGDKAAYTVDTITAPVENPWRSWMRFGGFDFFADGKRAAIGTWNGDVWIVSGIDGDLKRLSWKRIATGLFQPLGVKIVDEQIYVCCRDQITRLVDLNGDGEIDFYESFNNDHQVTEHFHEFAMDLQRDKQGNFYYAKSARHALDSVVPHHGTLIKVSKDGRTSEIVCNGFRAANGVGISPSGDLATSDQEGHWTPANRINLVRPGRFYGNMFSFHRGERPTGYDPPLCWLPKNVDRSPAEQLWVTSDRWGPLKGSMISTSYGTGQISLVPYEYVDGIPQGAAVKFPLVFPTGIMRARFHPGNGQLYVCGLVGWSSNKTQPGGFYRVRYTGKAVHMPKTFHAARDGIELGFTERLNRQSAENVDNYSLSQWNYRWTANYGSKHYLVSDPKREGADPVEVLSATLAKDGRTVFLRIKDLQPVMQMRIRYTLQGADRAEIRQDLYATLNKLGPARGTSIPSVTPTRPSLLTQQQQKNLRPGLLLSLEQTSGKQTVRDARSTRLAALHVASSTSPTPFLKPGTFHAQFDGFVKLDLKGDYNFSLKGTGAARLRVNGTNVLRADGDLQQGGNSTVSLHKGYNRLELEYTRPKRGDATVRLYWSSDEFATEPIPPSQLFHDGSNRQLQSALELREGRELFATLSCAKCHPASTESTERTKTHFRMPEMSQDNPNLAGVGKRLSEQWLYQWILNPHELRSNVTMPNLLHAGIEDDRRQAADLTAYLASLGTKPAQTPKRPGKGTVASGEILFEDLGCIACHRIAKSDSDDEFARTSLGFVHQKFGSGGLLNFLKKPHAHYKSSRMPDFRLTTTEAGQLAAFLRSKSATKLPGAPSTTHGDPKRGQQHFGRIGCANCHSVDQKKTGKRTPFLSVMSVKIRSIDRGCLAENEMGARKAPDYRFSKRQRTALAAFLETDRSSLARYSPAEASGRIMAALNCAACHKRDKRNSDWPFILADEGSRGKLPDPVPDLTWIGEKLKPTWTAALFSANLTYKPRPFIRARMPVFAQHAHVLATGLSAQHGFSAKVADSHRVSASSETIEIGRRLTLKEKGFNCVQCHNVGRTKATAPFEARGVDFTRITTRMRYDFFPRWMLNPVRIELSTKMPVLSPDRRRTALTHVYDGDAEQQFDAIWYYLRSLENQLPN